MLCSVIPARKHSKRIKNKNLVEINGKPLIKHTIDFCNSLSTLEHNFISTDCKEIASLAIGNVTAPFLRPTDLASDTSIDIEWILHFINWLEKHTHKFTHIMILRPTSPIRPRALVLKSIDRALTKNLPLRSVTRIPKKMSPDWSIRSEGFLGVELIENGFQTRSQDLSDYFYPNGLFDIVRISDVKNYNKLYGSSFLMEEIPETVLNDIDTHDDLIRIKKNWYKMQCEADKL